MIIKILGSSGSDFQGVEYNDKKMKDGTGELMLMNNFPAFINENSGQQEVRDYFKSVSKSGKVKKPQFHAVISTKFQQHSKEELAKIAKHFMDEMGYGAQPFLVVFHQDTSNNHVHIVSTRVDKQTGKKLNDSYERLKAQQSLSNTLEKLYGIQSEEKLTQLLDYKISTLNQLKILLERSGYQLVQHKQDENVLDILKNGVKQKTIYGDRLVFDDRKSDNRSRQIKAILHKYKELYSNKVFKVEDRRAQEIQNIRRSQSTQPREKNSGSEPSEKKIAFESELQKKLRDIFGIDLVFHHKDDMAPFGYTVIDHKTGSVYKGSELIKMNALFEFTTEKIDKKLFEVLRDYNIPNEESKKILLDFLRNKFPETEIKDFMFFENKGKKDLETYRKVQFEVKAYIGSSGQNRNNVPNISILQAENNKVYAIHTRYHYIGELPALIGEKAYQRLVNPETSSEIHPESRKKDQLQGSINELLSEFMKSTGTAKDPAENELKKKRKKKSR